MRNYKKLIGRPLLVFVALFLGGWIYYISIHFKHIYTLVDCSQGQVAFVPKNLCQAYLYNHRGTQDDVLQINHDGSLFEIVSTASLDDRSELLGFLLKKGVDINGVDERVGNSPLHAAVLDNALDVTELFLQHGANPLIKDKKRGLTPLELAMQLQGQQGQPDRGAIIKLLAPATPN